MLKQRIVVVLFFVLVMGAAATSAQDFPLKPIRIVAPEVGGSADFTARLLADGLTANVGQRVIVDNRGGGIIPGEIVANAAPDGYTLLLSGGSFILGPLLQKTPYDVLKDFAPITLAVTLPNVLVLHPSLPVRSVKELIALAKARPGELNYSSTAPGSSSQLAGELFKSMAGVSIVQIRYRGNGPALHALIAGEVQLSFAVAATVNPHVKSGKLRALAVTSAQRTPLYPELPTVAASGLPGFEVTSMLGVFAPARTPETLITRLNSEIVQVLNSATVKDRFSSTGVEVVASSPQQLAVAVRSQISKIGKVIKDANIRQD